MINKGADARDRGNQTPLHFAIESEKLKVVKCFIEKGTNVKDKCNKTSLHRTTRNGNIEVTKYLIKKGADVNAKDKDGNAPLH
ncbi:ankyrin repeat domain-containing protein [Wolbachia endosymbiont of Wuchereria bancrofti]|uniref:ankyrin repeat domain-containing protein n=1 Tax=Wolbachia endosymbiont of Wuchereria bancrofti TaxID=96496 RepID=UPI000B4C24E2